MKYRIRHVTTYRYASPASSAACTLRLMPRHDAEQNVLESTIDVTDIAQGLRDRLDFFGNRINSLRVESAHQALSIVATSIVEVSRPRMLEPARSPAWEKVRLQALVSGALDATAPSLYLFSSKLVALDDAVTAYAEESFPAGRPILDAAIGLMGRIKRDFSYRKDATEVTTTVAEAFTSREGVCQDFAHVMIAGLRGLGLPAAYVSGYIRTIPPPGKPRLEGADASHAWVSVWCGDDLGWIGLDPTNDILISEDHVVVAIGRDYADVSPVDGVFVGAGAQDLLVSVDVLPLDADAAHESI